MRSLLAFALLAGWLASASAARAATLVREALPAAGPAFAGEDLVWGERTAAGGLVVLRGRPGEEPRRLMEIPPPERADQDVYFGGIPGNLAASPQRVAFAVGRDTCVREESDVVGCTGSVDALTGAGEGPFTLLAPACEQPAYASVDVEGDLAVAALSYTRCEGRNGSEVWLAGSWCATRSPTASSRASPHGASRAGGRATTAST